MLGLSGTTLEYPKGPMLSPSRPTRRSSARYAFAYPSQNPP